MPGISLNAGFMGFCITRVIIALYALVHIGSTSRLHRNRIALMEAVSAGFAMVLFAGLASQFVRLDFTSMTRGLSEHPGMILTGFVGSISMLLQRIFSKRGRDV